MKILLIAGHGQGDSGAVGCDLVEADETRALLSLVYEKLKDYVSAVRYDTSVDCYQQSKAGNVPNYALYDYVVELHMNSYSDPSAHGSEILIHTTEPAHTVEDEILENLADIGFTNRGVKRRSDLLNMNNCRGRGVSYALIETCFISNWEDVSLYNKNKSKIAGAIASGILDGFGIKHDSGSADVPANDSVLYRVQVGAYRNKANAEAMKNRLKADGYDCIIKVD